MSFDTLSFACIDCGARSAAAGTCGSCHKDGLMDLRDPNVRAELVAEDDKRKVRRGYQMIWVAVPFTAVLELLIIFGLGGGLLLIALGAFGGYGLSLGLSKIFPAQRLFPYLQGKA